MKLVWTALIVALAAVAAVAVWRIFPTGRSPPDLDLSRGAGLTVEKIQAQSVLTTLKVDVADAPLTRIQGRTGSIQAVLIVHGQLTVGVDLSAVRFKEVDERPHTAVLLLPQPNLQSVSLDHEHTKVIGVWPSGLWTLVPGGEDADTIAVNVAYRDAERAVRAAADDPQLMDRARRQAESVLKTFLAALEWKVEIRWDA